MPAADIAVDEQLVRRLLRAQHPDLAGLPLDVLAFGWDNVVFRLGSDWVVRLPRRQLAADLVDREQRWLPLLAPRLPLPIPAPVRRGQPAGDYPWRWSICRYLPGQMAAVAPVSDDDTAAEQLGRFVVALHQPAPSAAPENPFRGVPLQTREGATQQRLLDLRHMVPVDRLERIFQEALEAPRWSGPPVWLHGDLHSANLLVHEERLSAVIDFGDLTAGDPATDLAAGWIVFGSRARKRFRTASEQHDEATWVRARGWAVALGLACLASSADNPVIAAVGRWTLDAVLEE